MNKLILWLLVLTMASAVLYSDDINNEDSSGGGVIFTNGVDLARYTITGDAAWDRLHLYSMGAYATFRVPIEDSPGYTALMTIGYKKPFYAQVNQLDGTKFKIDTGTSAYFFGIYGYSGFLIEKDLSIWKYYISAGPAFDLYMGSGRYLFALSLEGKADLVIPVNSFFKTGFGVNLGYDYWGIHNMGEATRYNGFVRSGFGAQVNVFFAFGY